MSLVEEKYNEALDRMSGLQRVERTLSLFATMRDMLTLQVQRENGPLHEREIRRKVAERLYLSDNGVQKLLKRCASIDRDE